MIENRTPAHGTGNHCSAHEEFYQPGQEIPDLGNWVRVHHDGAKRYYEGISTEVDLLPTYVEHGSRAVCLDTSEVYTFHEKLKKWFKLG